MKQSKTNLLKKSRISIDEQLCSRSISKIHLSTHLSLRERRKKSKGNFQHQIPLRLSHFISESLVEEISRKVFQAIDMAQASKFAQKIINKVMQVDELKNLEEIVYNQQNPNGNSIKVEYQPKRCQQRGVKVAQQIPRKQYTKMFGMTQFSLQSKLSDSQDKQGKSSTLLKARLKTLDGIERRALPNIQLKRVISKEKKKVTYKTDLIELKQYINEHDQNAAMLEQLEKRRSAESRSMAMIKMRRNNANFVQTPKLKTARTLALIEQFKDKHKIPEIAFGYDAKPIAINQKQSRKNIAQRIQLKCKVKDGKTTAIAKKSIVEGRNKSKLMKFFGARTPRPQQKDKQNIGSLKYRFASLCSQPCEQITDKQMMKVFKRKIGANVKLLTQGF